MENASFMPIMWFLFILMVMTIMNILIARSNNSERKDCTIILLAFVSALAVYLVSIVPIRTEALQQSKDFYEGRPIPIYQLTNDINKRVWTPLCPTRIGNDIVFYSGSSGRLYGLYKIKFEPGFTEENFLHSTNGSFLVYSKGTNLLIGPYAEYAEILATNSAK